MKKYRILEERGLFYPQRRTWFFFWENCIKCNYEQDRDYFIKTYFTTLKEAQHYINTKKVEDAANKLLGKKIHYVD